MFATYVSRHGHAFIHHSQYLPKSWTGDAAGLAAAHVPPGTAFATKSRLAVAMGGDLDDQGAACAQHVD